MRTSRFSLWEEEPGIRVPYHVVRHALSKSGPVRIHGLALTRAGDVVILRAVNVRDQTLPQFIEVPLIPEVLRQVAAVLETLAAQTEADLTALRQRFGEAARIGLLPDPPESATGTSARARRDAAPLAPSAAGSTRRRGRSARGEPHRARARVLPPLEG